MLRFIFCFISITAIAQTEKNYQKLKDQQGRIQSEGWMLNGLKTDYWINYFPNEFIASKGHFKAGVKEKYWYFYQVNHNLKKEGHFSLGQMSGWWIFYDNKGALSYKCQYIKNRKEGYCIWYKKKKIIKIEKYKAGVKIGEWKDLKSFELENNIDDLLK